MAMEKEGGCDGHERRGEREEGEGEGEEKADFASLLWRERENKKREGGSAGRRRTNDAAAKERRETRSKKAGERRRAREKKCGLKRESRAKLARRTDADEAAVT